ncbi:MAG: tetratricopeptide repeat protein [Clostridiales bacterium]|jgi:tetratricopeptide (TPR) repeat protein|nr:tetratricopeptide repeat protein [Clostridiales bacterium]
MTYYFFKKTTILLLVLSFVAAFIALSITMPISLKDAYGQEVYYYGIWGGKTVVENLGTAFAHCLFWGCCAVLAANIITEIIARRMHKKTLDVLYNDCNAKQFVELYKPIIYRVDKMKFNKRPNALFAYIFYSQGLFQIGDVKHAISVLENLTQNKCLNGKAYMVIKFHTYLNLLKYYHITKNADGAERCTTMIEETYKKFSKSRHQNDKNILLYMQSAAATNQFFEGKYREALEFYLFALKIAKSNYEQAFIHCYLAVIYDALGDNSEARAHLDMAVQKAPNIYSVTDTQQKLSAAY